MASFFVTHHKYPSNPKLFVVNVESVIKRRGEPNTEFFYDRRGEQYWELYIATDAVDASGDTISPFWADVVVSEATIDALVADKVEEICELIDWTNDSALSLQQDRYSPQLVSISPHDGEEDVNITSGIKVVLKEPLPGSGMDVSTLVFKVNGVSVTPRITGHPYEYTFEYFPKPLYD